MIKTIVTHSGTFHTDEVFASAILKYLNPDAIIIRTRDDDLLNEYSKDLSATLVDVGLLYDGKRLGDHHMNEPRLEYFKAGFMTEQSEKETILIMKDVFLSQRVIFSNMDMNKLVSKYLNITKFQFKGSFIQYIQGGKTSVLSRTINNFIDYANQLILSKDIIEINGLKEIVIMDSWYDKALTILQKLISFRKLSSIGIVWQQHGVDFIKCHIKENKTGNKRGYDILNEKDIMLIFNSIDHTFVRYLDLGDNGISYSNEFDAFTISDVIGNFNTNAPMSYEQEKAFERAMEFAIEFLLSMIRRTINAIVVEKTIFEEEYVKGESLQVFSEFIPKIEFLLGKKLDDKTDFISFRTESGSYRIMTIRRQGFASKKSLPKEWLEKNELGILNTPGLIFVHQALFTAEFSTLIYLKSALCLKN